MAQSRSYPPEMPGAKVETYKTVGNVKLNLWIYAPPDHTASAKRPAIVFFFGGGWQGGSPSQFAPQCKYLASRGMVAIAADYRVASRHGVKAVRCVEDAKSAVRWIRANAPRLGIDANRIAAGGGSAGGHLAAATATVAGFEDPSEDPQVSSVPNALVLFNPVVALAPVPGTQLFSAERTAQMRDRAGVDPQLLSPYHHIRKGVPPAIIFSGKADTVVPYPTIEEFCRKMKQAGTRCEAVGYEGAQHGFFNMNRGDNSAYYSTLRRADLFFVSLGWLSGEPSIPASH